MKLNQDYVGEKLFWISKELEIHQVLLVAVSMARQHTIGHTPKKVCFVLNYYHGADFSDSIVDHRNLPSDTSCSQVYFSDLFVTENEAKHELKKRLDRKLTEIT